MKKKDQFPQITELVSLMKIIRDLYNLMVFDHSYTFACVENKMSDLLQNFSAVS